LTTTLCIKGLDNHVDEKILHGIFSAFGGVANVFIAGANHNEHRGVGFINYYDSRDTAAAVDNMDCGLLFGRIIEVDYANNIEGE
jgi:RNA recognition motif-containing protein